MESKTLPTLRQASLPPRGSQLNLLRPGKDQEARIVILSNALELYQGHWGGRKTVACELGPDLCPHCLACKPSRVYGFAHVLSLDDGRDYAIMLTPDACYNLQDACRKHPRMRGFNCIMRRHLNRLTSPYIFIDKGFLEEEQVKIRPKSCEPTVRRIWHFEGVVDPRAARG